MSTKIGLVFAFTVLISCSLHKTSVRKNSAATPIAADRDRDDDEDRERNEKRFARKQGSEGREVEAGNRGMPPAPAEMENDDSDKNGDPKADSPDRALEFFVSRRWQQAGDFPTERFTKARQDAHRLPTISVANRFGAAISTGAQASGTFGNWQALGPGNVGGRVRAIAVDPTNGNTIYAAAASGGVWKTTDGGKTWNPLTDFLPVLGAGSLIIDPSNPQVLYLGTGETQHNAISLRGMGIFKTTNGGQTWSQLPQTSTSSFYYVNALALNPTQTGHLYAGTQSGLFQSLDGGATWTAVTLVKGSSYVCESIVVRSDQPTDYVFASCGATVNGVQTFTIFRNQDAAGTGTWDAVLTASNMSHTALALAPSAQGTIYALASNNDTKSPFLNGLLAMYRSTQNGDLNSWTTQVDESDPTSLNSNILSYPACPISTTNKNGNTWYNLGVAVSPTNPNTVWAMAVDVFRSDDGGVTWGWTNMSDGGHVDQHAIAFHPNWDGQANQTLWIGNDGGMYRTDQALGAVATANNAFCSSKIVTPWIDLNNGFSVTQFYHGTVVPGGSSYFGGTQDNGTPIGTNAGGPNAWGYLYGGDGGQVAVDPLDSNTMFYEYTNLALRKTVDGGVSNYSAINGIKENANNFLFINYYIQDPRDPMKVYTGATQLWRTLDEAENWTAASAPIAKFNNGNDIISAIAVDPNDSNHVLFGTNSGGRIYMATNALTSDGTATFPYSTPRSGSVSRIVFDPTRAGRVYASYVTFRSSPTSDSQIYRSDDGGQSWSPLGLGGTGPLPDVPVDSLLLDPDNPSTIYAGTDTGLLASFDQGVTWTRDSNPFADALVRSLIIEHEGGDKFLYAFTHGRGVWKVNLNSTAAAAACQYSLSASSFPVPGDETNGSLDVTTDASCTWTARPGASFVEIQSPAVGHGPGHVYFHVNYNNSGKARTDTFYVQDQAVTIAQSATTSTSHSGSNDLLANARVIGSLPYGDIDNNSNATSSATDPVHSCTNSADNKTLWWSYAATESGQAMVSVTGEAYQFAGNTGLAITAYPLSAGTLGNEMTCGTIPETKNASWKPGSIVFPVTAGSSYAIEVSGINSDTAYLVFEAVMLPGVSLSPVNPSIAAGSKIQFSASVLNTPNTAVRWIASPPTGTLDNAGNYTAPVLIDTPVTVTITARSFANSGAMASTSVTIQPPPISFSTTSIVNASSFQSGAVAPGEMVTIFGTSLGPISLAYLQVDASGKFLGSNIGNTQVTFDGVAAPLIYTSAGQLSAIVPYEVAGKSSTAVTITHNGNKSSNVTAPVTDAAPALFTLNQAGSGQAAAQSDNLPNSSAYPAAPGMVVTLYGTGEGQTNPPGQDGLLALTSPYPAPVLPVSVQIDGKDAAVQYAGTAPTDVAGILQVNAVVPADASAGDVPVTLTVGTHASPVGVTLNILGPDSRSAQIAYNNTGSSAVTISVYKPGDFTHPIVLGTVKAGAYTYVGTQQAGNNWGIQVNSSAIRIVQHVATYTPSGNPPYWSLTGTADNPFPR